MVRAEPLPTSNILWWVKQRGKNARQWIEKGADISGGRKTLTRS
jgi:hypothetical protein